MSISGALNSAVSALQAQSQQLSMISDDLANTGTTGYKTVNSSFSDLLTQQTGANTYGSGGVVSTPTRNVTQQGTIATTTTSTNVAIDGNGMFVVENTNSGEIDYTRDGSFTTDSSGNLILNGTYELLGWPTDATGKIEASSTNSTSSLQAVNVDRFASSAAATTKVTLQANLPADAASSASYTSSLAIYDSLGTAQSVDVTWTKSATVSNEWTATLTGPANPTTGATTGTLGGTTSYTIDFNSDGSLASIKDSAGATVTSPTITVSAWNDGAAASSITLSAGTAGTSTGLTQDSSGSTAPTVDIQSQTQDGYAYGKLSSVAIGTDGTVTATYDNGQKLPVYKIPIATFANEDGLEALSGNVYQATAAAGSYTLHQAGTGGAGTTKGSSLESSTVDTSDQFSKMIVAQQAYSAASQVISTAKTMFSDIIQAVR